MRQPSGWFLAAAVALFVGAVVAWVISGPHRTVIHDRPQPDPGLVVFQPPVATPLPRDSGPKNNATAKRTTRRSGSSPAVSPAVQRTKSRTHARRVPVTTLPAPRRKARHQPTAPGRPSAPQSQPSPSPAPHRPPSTVEVNPPLGPTVCSPLVSVRCP